jgi:DsbC/DsbD-like thiol-disulfide interchange protein
MTRLILLLPLVVLACTGWTQAAPKATLVLPKSAKAGKQVKATLRIVFEEGLHGYQNPPTKDYMIPVEVKSATKGLAIKPAYPKGVVKEFMGEETAVYEGAIEIPILITVPKKTGPLIIKLDVGYQQCTDEACYAPATLSVSGKLTITK